MHLGTLIKTGNFAFAIFQSLSGNSFADLQPLRAFMVLNLVWFVCMEEHLCFIGSALDFASVSVCVCVCVCVCVRTHSRGTAI